MAGRAVEIGSAVARLARSHLCLRILIRRRRRPQRDRQHGHEHPTHRPNHILQDDVENVTKTLQRIRGADPQPVRRPRGPALGYFPTTRIRNVPGSTWRLALACPSVAAAAGPYSAADKNSRCVFGSSAKVLAPGCVVTLSRTMYESGVASRITVTVPSPLELNTSWLLASYAVASTRSPIGAVVITRPLSASSTAIFWIGR